MLRASAIRVPKTRPPGVHGREDYGDSLELRAQVLVVGSGAGGATAAAELAEAGIDVIVLEEGRYHRTEDFSANASEMIRALYRDGGSTVALGRPAILYQEGRTIGGSTTINGGMAFRTPERVLATWKREHGLESILPEDMALYFDRVERRISVGPQSRETVGRDNALLAEGAAKKGWKVVTNRRNQIRCAGSNNCAFGCPTGAKQSALITYIPRALHFGARLYSDIRVEKITRQGRRATGAVGRIVEANGTLGRPIRVRADLVVSACGAIHTPALLSRSGLGAPSGMLGRNLSLHPNIKVIALFDEEVRGWQGVHQAYQVREFEDEGMVFAAVNVPPSILGITAPHYGAELGALMRDYKKMVVAGMLLEDTNTGRVRTLPGGRPLPFYSLSELDGDRLIRGAALLCELLFEAGARRIILPFAGVPDLRSPDDVKKIFNATIDRRHMEVVTVHLMGTARMGSDRARAVTDSYGSVHNTDRLMIADASLFPTPIGVNPALTIHALATRNMHHLVLNRRRYLG